ncbi:MAG TPA: amidase domain-containing protein [Chloroflexota bacterium]
MHHALKAAAIGFVLLLATPVSAATGYSGSSAASYADTYWSKYNAAWPTFANSGGDCTNFVSQALNAGGFTMRMSPAYSGNAAWFMLQSRRHWSYSLSWINAQDNSAFLEGLQGITQVATYTGIAPGQTVPSNASQGDVVLYDWNNDGVFDHEAIIATTDGQTVDAHTNNRYHAYWTLAQYNSSWQTTRIVVLHIPPTTS